MIFEHKNKSYRPFTRKRALRKCFVSLSNLNSSRPIGDSTFRQDNSTRKSRESVPRKDLVDRMWKKVSRLPTVRFEIRLTHLCKWMNRFVLSPKLDTISTRCRETMEKHIPNRYSQRSSFETVQIEWKSTHRAKSLEESNPSQHKIIEFLPEKARSKFDGQRDQRIQQKQNHQRIDEDPSVESNRSDGKRKTIKWTEWNDPSLDCSHLVDEYRWTIDPDGMFDNR